MIEFTSQFQFVLGAFIVSNRSIEDIYFLRGYLEDDSAIDIFQTDDEWYYVRHEYFDSEYYYRCDQFEGLLDLLLVLRGNF